LTDENTGKKMSATWETVVSYFNHSELTHINTLAAAAGLDTPFPNADGDAPRRQWRVFLFQAFVMDENS